MYCEKCGKENKIGTKFCTNCGNSLNVSFNHVVKEEKAPWFEEEFYALSKKYALPEKKCK